MIVDESSGTEIVVPADRVGATADAMAYFASTLDMPWAYPRGQSGGDE